MKKVIIVSSHRAERGLMEKTIHALEKCPQFDVEILSLDASKDFEYNTFQAYTYLKLKQPDIVIIPCDRQEAFAAVSAAFLLQIPIRCHFNAGEMVKGGTTLDETFRPMISLMCNVWFCDSEGYAKNVWELLKAVGRRNEIINVHNVGKPLDVIVDDSIVPNYPYDLVLYHPPTLTPETIPKELDEIELLINDNPTGFVFWGYPNGDEPGSKQIIERINEVKNKRSNMIDVFENVSRPQFFGLMKHCSRFISNSSATIAEAPMFLKPKQIIHIGKRNAGRQFEGVVESDPDKIVTILEELTCK